MTSFPKSSPRIAIIKPSSLGDIIHTLPLLKTLRRAFPSAYIAWVLEGAYQELLVDNKDLDEVIVIHTKKWRREVSLKSMEEIWSTIKKLRRLRFDIAIDLQGLLKSGVIAWLSNADMRLGFHKSNMREPINALFLNKTAEPAEPGKHAIERGLNLLKPLGIKEFQLHSEFPVSEKDKETAQAFFKEHHLNKPLVAINAGVGFPTKSWKWDRYAALADMLMEKRGCSILLTWGPGEREMVGNIAGQMKNSPLIPPATTVRQSAAFFKHCDLYIGSDTGPMQLSVALGVKCLVLMGSTDPLRNGPFGKENMVIQKDFHCKNCYKRKCDTVECMEAIQVQEVFEAASGMLGDGGNGAME